MPLTSAGVGREQRLTRALLEIADGVGDLRAHILRVIEDDLVRAGGREVQLLLRRDSSGIAGNADRIFRYLCPRVDIVHDLISRDLRRRAVQIVVDCIADLHRILRVIEDEFVAGNILQLKILRSRGNCGIAGDLDGALVNRLIERASLVLRFQNHIRILIHILDGVRDIRSRRPLGVEGLIRVDGRCEIELLTGTGRSLIPALERITRAFVFRIGHIRRGSFFALCDRLVRRIRHPGHLTIEADRHLFCMLDFDAVFRNGNVPRSRTRVPSGRPRHVCRLSSLQGMRTKVLCIVQSKKRLRRDRHLTGQGCGLCQRFTVGRIVDRTIHLRGDTYDCYALSGQLFLEVNLLVFRVVEDKLVRAGGCRRQLLLSRRKRGKAGKRGGGFKLPFGL